MDERTLGNILFSALAYAGACAVLVLVLAAPSFFRGAQGWALAQGLGPFLRAAGRVAVWTGWNTLGFLVASVLWPSWRRQPAYRVVLLSVIMGLFAGVFPIPGIIFFVAPDLILKLARKAPVLSLGLSCAFPGVICGLLVILFSQFFPPARKSSR